MLPEAIDDPSLHTSLVATVTTQLGMFLCHFPEFPPLKPWHHNPAKVILGYKGNEDGCGSKLLELCKQSPNNTQSLLNFGVSYNQYTFALCLLVSAGES